METKECLQCNNELKGRSDKKFCDDQCRTAFNNKLKSDTTFMRNVNNALRKNRKILEELIPPEEGKTKASRKRLEEKGFNFSYHTHSYTTKLGAIYYFCYEYGTLQLEGDYFMLVKRKDQF
jgi:Ser-tRNA(Ala) deacylase AlaX